MFSEGSGRIRERFQKHVVGGPNRISLGTMYRITDTNGTMSPYGEFFSEVVPTDELKEQTVDEIHPGPPYTTGGDFSCIKFADPTLQLQGMGSYHFRNDYSPYEWVWNGGFYKPRFPVPILWDGLSFSQVRANPGLYPDLNSLGSAAYSRLRPKVSEAELGLALAEAKEVTPMLKQTARNFSSIWKESGGSMRMAPGNMHPKRVADNFLLYQFGWKPFLSDLEKLHKAFHKQAAYMIQRYKDNDKWIRRRRTEDQVTSDELIYTSNSSIGCDPEGGLFINMIDPASQIHQIRLQSYTEVWYEGVFKVYKRVFDRANSDAYYLSLDEMHRQMTLYGAYVSPAVIYKATPWSWLLDWFTNAGNLIQEAQDYGTGEVVSKYMYLMHHQLQRYESRSIFRTSDGQKLDLKWYSSLDIKRRGAASTSFEFSPTSLSARQIAILAALGISRK